MVKLEVNKESGDAINEVLGITHDRAVTIRKMVTISIMGCDTVTESMYEVSERCENINEVAFAMFQLGALSQEMRDTNKRLAEAAHKDRESHSGERGSSDDPFKRALKDFYQRG